MKTTLLFSTLIFALIATACGGSDDKPAATPTSAPATQPAAATAAPVPTQPPAPTVPPSQPPAPTPAPAATVALPNGVISEANWRAFVVGIMGLNDPRGDKNAICRPHIDPPPDEAFRRLTQARAPAAPTEGPPAAQVTPRPGQQADFARLKAIIVEECARIGVR